MDEETYGLLKQAYWSLFELVEKTRFNLVESEYDRHRHVLLSLREAIHKKGGIA